MISDIIEEKFRIKGQFCQNYTNYGTKDDIAKHIKILGPNQVGSNMKLKRVSKGNNQFRAQLKIYEAKDWNQRGVKL